MSKSTVEINDYVSLAVMLLMFLAFIGGQAEANFASRLDAQDTANQAVEGHFRGEDE